MTPTRIAVFSMPEPGHFQLLRPLISGLTRQGADVRVYTARQFQPQVRSDGATLVDLFEKYPLELADDASSPVPCRYVSYAGHYAGQLARDLERDRPSLILCETFALIGRVIAGLLDLPWVNVSPGHDLNPERYLRRLEADPRVSIAPACHSAVASLRERYGLPDASPFSFVTSLSPFLNICCEPPSFLEREQRRVFEPLAFFGSLPSVDEPGRDSPEVDPHFGGASRVRVYVSFGSVVWRYYRQEAFAALQAISGYLASRADLEGLISLGRAELEPAQYRRLESGNVRLETYVDQPAVLREADVFVTHHGINSTHEAIFNRVPMLSYPFFWDQPALAAKCQDRGLAVPLGAELRGPLSEAAVASAMEALSRDAEPRRARLQRARDDELEVIAGRDAVLRRIMSL